jgi:hypothetical protein
MIQSHQWYIVQPGYAEAYEEETGLKSNIPDGAIVYVTKVNREIALASAYNENNEPYAECWIETSWLA